MRDNGAEDAREVARGEGDARLRGLGVVGLGAGQARVHHLDNRLERGKLHHGVGDLAAPERVDALVQPGGALLGHDLADAVKGALVRVRDGALGADLDGLKGAERNVGEELGRRGRGEVEARLVLGGGLGPREVGVGLLEVLVPAVLEGALGRVAEQRRGPAGEDAADALGAEDFAPRLDVARVELGVDLAAGLDEVEGRDGGVGEALWGFVAC